jgi:hypothetical protein
MKSMTETKTSPRVLGLFEWNDGKLIHIQARFDKAAVHVDKRVFISLVAFSQDVEAIRAALAAGLASPMWLKNVTLSEEGESKVPESVSASPSSYRIDAHRLGFGSIHALFTCRQQGFLPNDSGDALWQELKQERFTTPMLRGWLPHILGSAVCFLRWNLRALNGPAPRTAPRRAMRRSIKAKAATMSHRDTGANTTELGLVSEERLI